MTDESDNLATDHLVSRRSAMQLFTAIAGMGAFSSTAAADEQDETETETDEQEEESSEHPAGTEQLLNYLAARYGDILSAEDIEELEDDVAGYIETAETIDEYELSNGDDMALVFEAYRGSY